MHRLRAALRRLDGRGFKAYRDLRGAYDFGPFTLFLDRVQPDPYAPPSRVRLRADAAEAGFPGELWRGRSRAVGLADALSRALHASARRHSPRGGKGAGSLVAVRPGQEVVERSSAVVGPDGVELRLRAGLPARGRRIAGRQAEALLLERLPRLAEETLFHRAHDPALLERAAVTAERQDRMRELLPGLGLAAFVADGSRLARSSGEDDRPLGHGCVPFASPPSLSVTLDLGPLGPVSGMGVPRGVTLIVGGGYHGKSTLLRALERSVYNHVAGDGREGVVTNASACKMRAEDGRFIEAADISPFIRTLPGGRTTDCFRTLDASGSTSEAANILEAMEAGCELLLLDEDTSATNFMIRDERMRRLVRQEPIRPFRDRIRPLFRDRGVSTILVMGGSGDYFDVADLVLRMNAYRPEDATGEAAELARDLPPAANEPFPPPAQRIPLPESFDPSRGRRAVHVRSHGTRALTYGRCDVDLGRVEQLLDEGQTLAVAEAMALAAERYADGKRTLSSILDALEADLERDGLDGLSDEVKGERVRPRRWEVAAAFNRLRTLRCRRADG